MLFYKSSIIIILSILLSSQKAAEAGRTYTYDDGEVGILNGHVKQIVALRQSELGNRFMDTITTIFDKKGRQTEVLIATPLGKKSKDDYINSYDNNGKVTETKMAGSPVKGVYTYNNTGYTIKVLFTPDDPQSSANLYSYDKDGYLTMLNYYEKPKVLVDVIKYKYDKNHRLIETEQRSAKGEPKLRRTFQYLSVSVDSKNNWIKQKVIIRDIYPSFANTKTHELSRKIFYY